jgi:hypothetical protein
MLDTNLIKSSVTELMAETRKWHSQREYRGLSKDEFVEQMKTKFDYLYNNSSTLFERAMQGDINMDQLNFMLGMINRVNNGEDYQKASVAVGQRMVDTYVKPMLEKQEKEKDEKND